MYTLELTPHAFLVQAYHGVVVSYEFLRASYRGIGDFKGKCEVTTSQNTSSKRPKSPLLSNVYRVKKPPIKCLTIDKAPKKERAGKATSDYSITPYFLVVLVSKICGY